MAVGNFEWYEFFNVHLRPSAVHFSLGLILKNFASLRLCAKKLLIGMIGWVA